MSRERGARPDVRWWPVVAVGGVRYRRATVRTAWIHPGEDMAAILAASLEDVAEPGDIVVVSEKAVVIAAGLGVNADDVVVSSLAQRLAGWVRPTEGSRGLSIPEKMEYVLRQVGLARMLAATVVAGLTRPLGLRGGFYLIAGWRARAMDGMRPPFEHLLLPPLAPRVAQAMARQLALRIDMPVAIVDINDRGGSVRAVSHPTISRRRLRCVLADNPLGQRDARTPIGLVRIDRVTSGVAASSAADGQEPAGHPIRGRAAPATRASKRPHR